MILQTAIEQKLIDALAPIYIDVVNESGSHSVPPGSETHFKVVLVADTFTDQRLIARHRRVNGVLAEELAGGVHALALHTYTPEEWQSRFGEVPESPACLGGGRRG
ncbi:MAG: BolA/IbaG family iron-sulfur metabolism protein [Gammaproteobacteria bacterium]|nr:MAG: BolA/IbaG family iron-sulfur metabolism protein [Gammaproteobacteria bacterium]